MFEDIVNLDDRSVQLVLRQVESADLALALKGVSETVRAKITANLSERAAETLLEEIELLGAGPADPGRGGPAGRDPHDPPARGAGPDHGPPQGATMSSSSEARSTCRPAAPAEPPDLRTGVWTRLGDDRVLGDAVTEAVLGALAERTRDAAQAQGYAVGWAEGQRGRRCAAAAAEARGRRRGRAERAAPRRASTPPRSPRLAAAAGRRCAPRRRGLRPGRATRPTDLALERHPRAGRPRARGRRRPRRRRRRRVLAVCRTTRSPTVRLHPATAGLAPRSPSSPTAASTVRRRPDPRPRRRRRRDRRRRPSTCASPTRARPAAGGAADERPAPPSRRSRAPATPSRRCASAGSPSCVGLQVTRDRPRRRRRRPPRGPRPRPARCRPRSSPASRGALTCLPLGRDHRAPRRRPRRGTPAARCGSPSASELRGRVLDGLGRPIDGGPPLDHLPQVVVDNAPPPP